MSQALPNGGFKWLNREEINCYMKDELMKTAADSQVGYMVEVDLDYPDHLHAWHNDYPLAVERMGVKMTDLSEFQKEMCNLFNSRPNPSVTKLIPNLYNKTDYVLHYRNLQYYIKMGLVLNRIHKVLRFNQSTWLRDFIEYNVEKRKNCATSSERDFFKLQINSNYGRTLLSLRKQLDLRLTTDKAQAK